MAVTRSSSMGAPSKIHLICGSADRGKIEEIRGKNDEDRGKIEEDEERLRKIEERSRKIEETAFA